jgi:hypothetical protein
MITEHFAEFQCRVVAYRKGMCPLSPRHDTSSVDVGTGIDKWTAATKIQSSREQPKCGANPAF